MDVEEVEDTRECQGPGRTETWNGFHMHQRFNEKRAA
jgi:hypothetical protein